MVFSQFQPDRPGGMVRQKAVGFTRSPYRQRGGIIGSHVLMDGYSPRQMRYITRRMTGTKRRKGKRAPRRRQQRGGFVDALLKQWSPTPLPMV